MNNRKSQIKLVKKMVSLHPKRHIDIIDHFIEEGRHNSESDVVRAALVFYHDKIYPNYIFHLSPAAKKKQKEIEVVEEAENLTDEEFALSIGFLPVENEDGDKLAFYRYLGHTPELIPLEGIKEWAEANEYRIPINKTELAFESLEKYFSKPWGERFVKDNHLIPPTFPSE